MKGGGQVKGRRPTVQSQEQPGAVPGLQKRLPATLVPQELAHTHLFGQQKVASMCMEYGVDGVFIPVRGKSAQAGRLQHFIRNWEEVTRDQ